MYTVGELLTRPQARGLRLVAGPPGARSVEQLSIVDAPDDLRAVPSGTLALLTPHASSQAGGYRLDVMLRLAGEHDVAALAIYGEPTTSATATHLADRAGVAVVAVDPERELTDLTFALARVIREDPGEALARVLGTLDAVTSAERTGSDAVLAAAGDALGVPLALRQSSAGSASAAIVVDGRVEEHVVAEREDPAVLIGVRLVADAVGRLRAAERRAVRAPLRARGEALVELLLAPTRALGRIGERARDLGFHVDGVHCAACIDVHGCPSESLADAHQRNEEIAEAALASAADADGASDWHAAWIESVLVVVRTQRRRTVKNEQSLLEPLDHSLEALAERYQGIVLHCGAGSARAGVEGLRQSYKEAAAAMTAARNLGRTDRTVSIDAVGMPRVIIEWLASDAAQESVQRMLEPLEELGVERARTAIQTLQIYLDEQGSLARSADRLHLHRNAVAYRIRRIEERLEADLSNPEQRLALQLACRARLLRLREGDASA